MALVLSTPASVKAVPLDVVMKHLRLEESDDDRAEVERLLKVATAQVEHDLDRQLKTATWKLYMDAFPSGQGPILLERPPVLSVTDVDYIDSSGSSQSLTAVTDYQEDLVSEPARLTPAVGKTWPITQCGALNAVTITFTAGYTTVPSEAQHAIKLLVSHWYENREAVAPGAMNKVPLSYQGLIDALRWRSVVA